MPFIAEEIYQNLTQEKSVHLADFPQGNQTIHDQKLIEQMQKAREIVEKTHGVRKEKQIKVRQPLSKLEYPGTKLPKEIEKIIAGEVNVKKIANAKTFKLDTNITPRLKTEGEAREIKRQVVIFQKKLMLFCQAGQKVLPTTSKRKP